MQQFVHLHSDPGEGGGDPELRGRVAGAGHPGVGRVDDLGRACSLLGGTQPGRVDVGQGSA